MSSLGCGQSRLCLVKVVGGLGCGSLGCGGLGCGSLGCVLVPISVSLLLIAKLSLNLSCHPTIRESIRMTKYS